jgi:hypothetical protein
MDKVARHRWLLDAEPWIRCVENMKTCLVADT